MDLIWSIGLIVVIMLALNHMAGGRSGNVLRPVTGVATRLITLAVRAVLNILGTMFKLGASSVRLPKPGLTKDTERGPGPPPTRWD